LPQHPASSLALKVYAATALVKQNIKSFSNQIVLEEFFAARFLFAIDRKVQRWFECVSKQEYQ
jgi:hypothetical protein